MKPIIVSPHAFERIHERKITRAEIEATVRTPDLKEPAKRGRLRASKKLEKAMIISYDNLADAVYIKIRPEAKVDRTVEFAPETFVDLDEDGDLIGIEMLNPGQLILKRIAKKFHRPELSKVHPHKIQEAIA